MLAIGTIERSLINLSPLNESPCFIQLARCNVTDNKISRSLNKSIMIIAKCTIEHRIYATEEIIRYSKFFFLGFEEKLTRTILYRVQTFVLFKCSTFSLYLIISLRIILFFNVESDLVK